MIRYAWNAQIAFDQLTPSQQKKIQQTLHALEQSSQNFENGLAVRKLDVPDNIYLVRVGPSLRILFQNGSGVIEVQDIVTQERLNAFHAAVVAGQQ